MTESPTSIAVAVVEHEHRFLVGLRPAGKTLAGLWEFPGGRVEQGESPQAAAIRECREETGLDVTIVGRLGRHDQAYDHDTVRLHFFSCRPLEPHQVPREPFRWVPRAELAQLTFPDGNRDLLRELLAE